MKRRAIKCLMAAGILAFCQAAFGMSEMSVQVKTGQIRATPSYLGQVLATVDYGARVEVLQQRGDWMEVQASGNPKGWMHASALTKKKIVMRSGDEDVSTRTSGEELALAGKGFNSDVEKQFKSQNPNLNFAAVVRMLQIKVPAAEMRTFLQAGAVRPVEGGTK